ETTVGRTSILTLTNPSSSPATVDLEFFGDKPLTQAPPSSRGLQVKPGTPRHRDLHRPDERSMAPRGGDDRRTDLHPDAHQPQLEPGHGGP
ncbi:hypothetical protein CTI14_60635, partial [Methylobacterium radiotolerans]